jgi:hypothetical protein
MHLALQGKAAISHVTIIPLMLQTDVIPSAIITVGLLALVIYIVAK